MNLIGAEMHPDLTAHLDRLRKAQADLIHLRAAIEAGDPWPAAEYFGVEPEAAWGPREVLAHVAEMLPYWLGELERVVAADVEPAPFGRVQSDAVRIATIERDRTLPLRELFDRIDAAIARYQRRLSALDEADAGRRGLHPSIGEMTIPAAFERLVVGHFEGHVVQLREALASVPR